MIQVEQYGSVTAIRMARTLFGRPLYWTTAYWLEGLLIDSGPSCLSGDLMRVLDNQLPIEQVAITHAHEDHIGGLSRLRERFPDIPVYASERSIPFIQRPERLKQQLYRRLLWGQPQRLRDVEPLPLTLETENFRLRVIESPGHSADHVAFFEERHRWLFSGDSYIGGRERAWSPEFEMFALISSLRTLAALHPERLFPSSGNVRRTPLPEIHGKIGRLLGLCRDVGQLDALGLPSEELIERLCGGEPPIRFWTGGHFSAANLIDAARRYNELFDPEAGSQSRLSARTRSQRYGERSRRLSWR